MRGSDGRRGRRPAAGEEPAVQTKEAAGTAFYDMDQAEKYVRGRISLFTDLDPSTGGDAAREFDAVVQKAHAASVAYISVVDAHSFEGQARSPAEWDSVARAFRAVTDRMVQVTADINRFAERLAPKMARLEAALDRLPPKLAAAREGVAAADAAVTAARDGGFDATDPGARLDEAKAELSRLSSAGLGGLGLAGAIAAAESVAETAARATEEAAELPKQAERTRQSLASAKTRVDVVSARVDVVREAMRTLLRGYSQACWKDLLGAPEAITAGVERASERLAEANTHVERTEWRRAQQAMTAARTELNGADRRAKQVTNRVERLAAVKADPEAALEPARFAVRDAQRLAVAQRGGAPAHHARTLDALVSRIERAPRTLTGPNPDYWAYLTELDTIRTEAGDVVARIRSERADQG